MRAARARLCDPAAKVSAHYLIDCDGTVFMLVEEQNRAWHAGEAWWEGIRDVNSASIGIELDNAGHSAGLPDFPPAQISALTALLTDIRRRYALPPHAFVGHSDIAPLRKRDPGEHFPWQQLAEIGLGQWPGDQAKNRALCFQPGEKGPMVAAMGNSLAGLGYLTTENGEEYDETLFASIQAFQRRYRPDRVDGLLDRETLDIIQAMVKRRFADTRFNP